MDSTFTTRIELEPVGAGVVDSVRRIFGGRPPLRLEIDEHVPDARAASTLQQVRDVEAPLPPGRWLLRVTVTTPSGRTAARERRITVGDDAR